MRILTAATAAALLNLALAAPAFAADSAPASPAPLSPGKPAGLKQAQGAYHTLFWIVGLGIVATGIVLLAEHHNDNITPITTGTP